MKLQPVYKKFIRAYIAARVASGFYVTAGDEYDIAKILNMWTFEQRTAIEDYIKELLSEQ